MDVGTLLRRISAWPRREHDEGAAARVFQMLLLAQVPIKGYFALTRLPRAPRPAAVILAAQVLMALAAIAIVVALGG